MRKVEVIKPWRFSRHGYDFDEAAIGAKLEVADDLAEAGVISGHIKIVGSAKMRDAAPENKSASLDPATEKDNRAKAKDKVLDKQTK